MKRIEEGFDQVIDAMKLQMSDRQMYQCLSVIEFMRR